jgi:hypothetical protein
VSRLLLLLALACFGACSAQDSSPAPDEGKRCSARADCVEICADYCSAADGGTAGFHCTTFNRATAACLCGITVDGGVKPLCP